MNGNTALNTLAVMALMTVVVPWFLWAGAITATAVAHAANTNPPRRR